jgi:tight adherence protein C
LAAALERLLEQLPYEALRPWAGLIAQSSHSGGNIAAQLRLQAQQRQEERFARAEKLAMQAPVKMLGPLLLCIFPCSFIVLATPILVRLLTTN